MESEELKSLRSELEKNEKEWRDIKRQYKNLWATENYGCYIGKFVKCELYYDGRPITDKYLYVNSINCSTRYGSHIVITGVGFDIQQWFDVSGNTRKAISTKFNFNSHFQIDIDIDDVKFTIITEEEWHKELKKQIKLLNKFVNKDMELKSYKPNYNI